MAQTTLKDYRLDLSSKTLVKIDEKIITSNTSIVDFTGLSNTTGRFLIKGWWKKSQTGNINLYVNNFTSNSPYWSVRIWNSNGSVGGDKYNSPAIALGESDNSVFFTIETGLVPFQSTNHFYYQSTVVRNIVSTAPEMNIISGSLTGNSITSITSLRLSASVSNEILAGSRFILYEYK